MKKLMIAAAIVCAAAISQAAAVTWGVTGITNPESPTGATAVGGAGYFMAATTFEAFSALSADKVAAYCAENATYTGTIAGGRSTTLAVTSGSYETGADISGYVVIFDKDVANYAYTDVISTTAPSSGNAKIQPAFSATSGWKSTAGGVPEPTSGLLLLLGLAGLALKRRA